MSLVQPTPEILRQLGHLLDELADSIEELGGALCSDIALISQHMGTMQSIDSVSQTVRQIGIILTNDDPTFDFSQIRLEGVRDRLQRGNEIDKFAA